MPVDLDNFLCDNFKGTWHGGGLFTLTQPEIFKDTFEKNEMAIALEKLEIAYDFISEEQLAKRKEFYPSLRKVSKHNQSKAFLEDLFKLTQVQIKDISVDLFKHKSEDPLLNLWISKLEKIYPNGDIGIIVLTLMNILELSPGTAIYTPAGIPHAYLSGELIEIMTQSDNVIRSGLTSKKIDYGLFLECLETRNKIPEIIRSDNLIIQALARR